MYCLLPAADKTAMEWLWAHPQLFPHHGLNSGLRYKCLRMLICTHLSNAHILTEDLTASYSICSLVRGTICEDREELLIHYGNNLMFYPGHHRCCVYLSIWGPIMFVLTVNPNNGRIIWLGNVIKYRTKPRTAALARPSKHASVTLLI